MLLQIPDIVELGFAIAVAGAVVAYLIGQAKQNQRFLQRLVENHLEHNTRALNELSKAVVALNVWLRRNERPVGKGP